MAQSSQGRLLRRALWAGLALYGFACVVLAYGLVEVSLHPPRRSMRQPPCPPVEIMSGDGLRLRGSLCDGAQGSPAVILAHGVADNRLGVAGAAQMMRRNGFTVLMPDNRGHGLSEGDVTTYGQRETDDLRRWAAWLTESRQPAALVGFGASMGAAEMLQAVRPPSPFCAVVAESPFTDLRTMAYTRVGQFFGVAPWLGEVVLRPGVEAAILYSWVRYDVDLNQIEPIEALKRSRVPVLLIHGTGDRNVPFSHSERLLAARPASTELWNAGPMGHVEVFGAKPAEYEWRVMEFLGRQLRRCAT